MYTLVGEGWGFFGLASQYPYPPHNNIPVFFNDRLLGLEPKTFCNYEVGTPRHWWLMQMWFSSWSLSHEQETAPGWLVLTVQMQFLTTLASW